MRFVIIVKATPDSEQGAAPGEEAVARMAAYHEDLAAAGVLLDAAGLQPSARGWRVRYSGEKRTIVDGPFTEATELIAGYALIEVRSREEAMEWSRRFPNPSADGREECEIEVRPLLDPEAFQPGSAMHRFRERELSRQISTPGSR